MLMNNKDIELSNFPSLTKGYVKAAIQMATKSLTLKHSGSCLPRLPIKRFILRGYQLNVAQVRQYVANTQLADRNVLPITYLYSVAFPIVIKLLTESDFPYTPVGLVHLYNTINQYKEIATDAIVDVYVHVDNMREHRAGLLVDVITEVYTGSVLVWSQVSTMLRRQKTSVSNSPKAPIEVFDKSTAFSQETIKATAEIMRSYAAISGDRNPIHMSSIIAKIFGFPQIIAHGSWMMARILSSSEAQLPVACSYKIQFGKAFLVPSNAELCVVKLDNNHWSYCLENLTKEHVILTAQITSL